MKKFLILFFLLFSFQVFSQEYSDFKWLHEKPQGNTLRWVKMWDANNWYALGAAGTFMKTTDAGNTWWFHHQAGMMDVTDGSSSYMYDAHFFDMNNGVVVGVNGIRKTTDGGVTFQDVTGNIPSAATAYQVFFLNDQIGYVAGTTSMRMARTSDGGNTWTTNTLGVTSGTFYDVWSPNDTLIIVSSGSGNIRRSTDGGLTWTQISTGATATLYKLEFADALNGWVAGSSSAARYTTDAGLTWTSANTGIPTSTFYDIDFVPQAPILDESFENTIFPPAGWQAINVLGTATWVRSTAQYNSGAASAFINYQSTGGEDWLITPKVTISADDDLHYYLRKNFTSTYIPDSLYIMVSTTDSALTSFTSIFGLDVNALTNSVWDGFMTDLSPYAGQNIYIAFKHIDLDGNGVYLDDVKIGSANPATEVWLTGNSYDLYKSADMGLTWTAVGLLNPSQPWTSTWYSTYFLNNTILSVGAFGLINKKEGSNTPVTFTQFVRPGTLYDIWVGDAGKIITVGAPGITGSQFDQIMTSTDYGNTWDFGILGDNANTVNGILEAPAPFNPTEDEPGEIDLTPNSTATFRGIDMLTANIGFAAGSNSAIYKTTNGGLNWDSVATNITTGLTFYGIDFVNANTGWVFGSSNDIWKTTDGGTTWTQQITTGFTSTSIIYAGRFADELTGYICGSSGHINKTTDGGTTWVDHTGSAMGTSTVYNLDLVDANTVYVCGATGKVARTTDGGTVWTLLSTPNTNTLYDVDFFDVNFGAVSGATGLVLLTTDGGTTWQVQNNGGSTNYAVFMYNPVNELDTAAVYTAGTSSYIHRKPDFIVPVELLSFTANIDGNTVTLSWGTATEVNNLGFDIERGADNNWQKIGFVAGKGSTTELQNYTFVDKNLAAGKYNYRIQQIDFDGTYKYYNLSEIVEISIPDRFELSQNYPNPFNPSTTINYSIAKSGPVTLKIYNLLGREIMTLVNGYQEAGRYTRIISVSELGNLSSGVYFYTLDAGSFKETRKMMILK